MDSSSTISNDVVDDEYAINLISVSGVTYGSDSGKDALKAFNAVAKAGDSSAEAYLNDAVDGTKPFAVLKVSSGVPTLHDGYQYTTGKNKNVGMVLPADYPTGTYNLEVKIKDNADNISTIPLKLVITE